MCVQVKGIGTCRSNMIIYHWYSFTCIREKKHHALAFSTSLALSACEGNESKPNMIMMQFPSKISPHLKIGQNIGSEQASRQGVVAKRATEMNICALLACCGFAGGSEDRPQGSWEPASCPSCTTSCMQMASSSSNWIGQGGLRWPSYVAGPVITTHNNSKAGRMLGCHYKPRGARGLVEQLQRDERGVKRGKSVGCCSFWRATGGDRGI